MAEKKQEHLRIRVGAALLKRIDAAREKSGRTRTDEIEARLHDSFTREDVSEVATLAARELMRSLRHDALALQLQKGNEPVTFDEVISRSLSK